MDHRNYREEMNARVDELQEDSDDSAGVIAEKLYIELSSTEPDLLEGWKEEMVLVQLAMLVATRRSNRRNAARKRTARALTEFASVFSDPDASEEAKEAARERLQGHVFNTRSQVVNDKSETRKIGELTGRDCHYIANHFTRSAKHEALMAEFYKQVGDRIGSRTIADVFSEEEFVELHTVVVGS